MTNLVYVNTSTQGVGNRPAFDPEDMLGIDSLVYWNSPTLGNSRLQTSGQFDRIMSLVGPDLKPVRNNEEQEEPIFRSYREGVAGCALFVGTDNRPMLMATDAFETPLTTLTYAVAFVDRNIEDARVLTSFNGRGNGDLHPYFRTGGASSFAYWLDYVGGPNFAIPKVNDVDSWQWIIVSKTPSKMQAVSAAGSNVMFEPLQSTATRVLVGGPLDTVTSASQSIWDGYMGDALMFNEDLFAAGNEAKLATLKTYMHAITGRVSFA